MQKCKKYSLCRNGYNMFTWIHIKRYYFLLLEKNSGDIHEKYSKYCNAANAKVTSKSIRTNKEDADTKAWKLVVNKG